jgi:LysM repeat protein
MMVEDHYEDGQDMMEFGFSGLSQGRKGGGPGSPKKHSDPGTGKKALLLMGAALLIVIVIISIALFAGNGSSGKPVAAIQARVKAVEEKVMRFSAMEANVATAQQQEEALRQSVSRLQSSVTELKGTLDHVSREVALLKERMGTTPGAARSTTSTKRERISKAHPRYHVVRKGESLYSIAKKYGISVHELYRLNKLSPKSTIHPGQRLMLAPGGKT